MAKQAKIALTDGLKSRVIDWTVWRVPSSFFGNISGAIFLSQNAFLRNIRKQAKKKKKGKKSLEVLTASVSPVIRKARCQLPKTGLRWSQNSNYSNRKQWSTYKGRKIEWLALSFLKKEISNVGKKGKEKWRSTASKTLILHTRQHLGRATCPVNSRPAYQA